MKISHAVPLFLFSLLLGACTHDIHIAENSPVHTAQQALLRQGINEFEIEG